MKVSKLVRWLSDINKFITSVGYLTAKENEVELLTTKFYHLHIVGVKNFTEQFSDSNREIGPVCVFVCVCDNKV